jgi:hypothetical protein
VASWAFIRKKLVHMMPKKNYAKTYVLIYKCKMQLMSNGFNMLKVDGSTHVPCQ